VPACEKFEHGVALAEAELEGEETVGAEGGLGLRDETAVDLEAVGAGEEGDVGLVVDDFGGERWGVGGGDVGWVGDDDVEGRGGGQGSEQVGLEEAEGEVEAGGVGAGYGEGGG